MHKQFEACTGWAGNELLFKVMCDFSMQNDPGAFIEATPEQKRSI